MTTSAPTRPDPFTQQLQAIDQLLADNDLPAVAQRLNAAFKERPGDARIFVLAARMAEAAGNPNDALDAARNAVALAPDWSPGVIGLAQVLARQDQFPEAIAQATQAVAMAPGDLQVLTRAIDVAHQAQHTAQALTWLQQAQALAPDHVLFRRLIAQDLATLGRHAEAQAAWSALVDADAGDTESLLGRARAALAQGDTAQATADTGALVALAPDNETFAFWQRRARGETPATQPAEMVRALHDAAAPVYDQHMVRGLRYQLPKQMAERILALHPDKKLNVLDLGCGTGLLGVCLGRIDGYLIGVDVSTKMIEQAARHNVYDRFHTVNLLDALQATPEGLYDVIAACDVFIYVGDLSQAIPGALRVLKPGGRLMFSCEAATAEEGDLALRPTMRYAHGAGAIEALCHAAGFDAVSVESTTLRLEAGEPVAGFVVVAHKPA